MPLGQKLAGWLQPAPGRMLLRNLSAATSTFQMQRGYGATAARLTPDQKVGSSNLSGLIFAKFAIVYS